MRQRLARAAWLLIGVCASAALLGVRPAAAQLFRPFSNDTRNILEGNWQSCRERDGTYAERVYDHVVNGVGQFEVHMGPRREFAIFKGVQDAHREHESPENLLKPFRVDVRERPREQRWEIPVAEPRVHRDHGRRLAHRLRELVHPARADRQDVALIAEKLSQTHGDPARQRCAVTTLDQRHLCCAAR